MKSIGSETTSSAFKQIRWKSSSKTLSRWSRNLPKLETPNLGLPGSVGCRRIVVEHLSIPTSEYPFAVSYAFLRLLTRLRTQDVVALSMACHLRARRSHLCPSCHHRHHQYVITPLPSLMTGYVLTYGSTPIGDSDPDKLKKASLQHEAEKDEQVARARAGSSSRALSGWLTVRRQFKPTSSGVTSIFTSARTTDLSGAKVPSEEKEEDAKPLNGAPTTYSGRIAHTYRQMLEARQAKKDSQPKEFFFCVLKGSVLFLYDDEAQSDCVAAIGVDKYLVSVEPSTGERFKGKDAEMFSKRTGLVMRLAEKVGKEKSGLPVLVKGIDGEDEREMENAPWFLFTISNIK